MRGKSKNKIQPVSWAEVQCDGLMFAGGSPT